jgi:hypothetical protein
MADLKIRAAFIAKVAEKEIARHTKSIPTGGLGIGAIEHEPPLMGLKRYPEFKPLVDKIVVSVIREINAEAHKIQSEMPYKAQFTLEEVIRELQDRV